MKTALFTNFTSEEFVGYWDGKGKKFAPGQSLYMPDYLAAHFAKHLVNRELLRTDANGNLVHKDGDKMTSPKKPNDVPLFMELFNKAFQPDETEDMGSSSDGIDALIGAANKNRNRQETKEPKAQDPNEPQIVLPPDDDEDESEFNNAPEKAA